MGDASLIHADIFFFISTIALVLITAGIVTASVYVIAILRNVRDMTDKGKEEWSEIVSDSKKLRFALRDEGVKWKHVVDLARNFFVRDSVKRKPKAKTESSEKQ
ncbi:MAG TPA: hypothetical protein VFT82_02825 [Candidatus Paceibacterota bacterium]|nr:hypothetical protein [Candidatus Paceibacterota bacterium]